MKKLFIISFLGLFVITLAGCGESLKTKTKLSAPTSESLKDNTLQTGIVAGDQDVGGAEEKPLSKESFGD